MLLGVRTENIFNVTRVPSARCSFHVSVEVEDIMPGRSNSVSAEWNVGALIISGICTSIWCVLITLPVW